MMLRVHKEQVRQTWFWQNWWK